MVNELAKMGSSTTPGEIKPPKASRDRKRTYSETARSKVTSQALLDESQKKPRQTAATKLTAKQMIDLVPRLSNEEVSKLVGSLLKRRKFKKDQAAPSTFKTPGPILPKRSGKLPPQPAQPGNSTTVGRPREFISRKDRDSSRMRRKEDPQSSTATEEKLTQEKHLSPLSTEAYYHQENDLAHDLLSHALR